MCPRRMEKVLIERSNVQRNRNRTKPRSLGAGPDELFRDDGDQIGFGDHVQRLQVVRNGEHQVSLGTLLMQPRIHRILREFAADHSNVLWLVESPPPVPCGLSSGDLVLTRTRRDRKTCAADKSH
jgi:hypothetical protein